MTRHAARPFDSKRDAPAVFDRLVADPHPFFLDSGIKMPVIGRYSILGSRPFAVLIAKGRDIEIRRGGEVERKRENPFEALREMLAQYRVSAHSELPFVGGAVGFLSYDLGRFVERLPDTTVDDIGFPDMYFAFYDRAAVFDNYENACHLVAAELGEDGSAEEKLDDLEARLNAPPQEMEASSETGSGAGEIESNFTKAEYLEVVQRTKDYIAAGDIFQANISQRFHTRINISPYALYRKLRAINPAPFACYLEFDDKAIVSASPERFLRVRDRRVQTRPVKGTRPRGRDPESDRRLREELLASEKDAAELTMIVDLERNDLGRVCDYGTVRVTEHKAPESYPTVHHLVSTVEGRLHERYDRVDLLKATFPGGSITGAPKIRAMEIIDELEPTKRSVYTGGIGYIGFDGGMDLNIVIRTFLIRGRDAWFQVGGGIVADSELESEYDETLHKARALIESVST